MDSCFSRSHMIAGWTLYIDNNKTIIFPAFDTFMAADISQGTHDICLEYKPQGLTEGIIISVFSLAVLLFYCYSDRRKVK